MRGVLFAMAWTFAASTRLALVITNRHSMARVEPRCQCLLRNILESPYGEMLETGRSGRFLGRTAEKLVTCEEQCQADVLKELCRVAKDCTKDVVVFRLEITLSAKESHQRSPAQSRNPSRGPSQQNQNAVTCALPHCARYQPQNQNVAIAAR